MADQVLLLNGMPMKVIDLNDGTFAWYCRFSNEVATDVLTANLDYETEDGAIGVIPAGALVMRRLAVVTEVWDTAATLQVGIAGDADRYMAAGDLSLQIAGSYQLNDAIHEEAIRTVLVDFNHAGATQGSLVLVIEYMVL